ncbi:MAG: division plane positioning ATPase MipZ [Alphaproteobacteria bacterium]
MNQPSSAPPAPRRGHIIVIGNEKGGSGKTTTTLHLMVALLRLGFKVGSMDIDARQRSLTRYLENRKVTIAKEGVPLPMPQHVVVNKSPYLTQHEVEADERDRFTRALAKLLISCDFVIIDAPGNDTYLSRLAHSFADTVLTPINDSFVDLDVLATVDGNTLEVIKPSIYSEMLWEQKMLRVKRDGGSIDWIVMRNRLSNIDARNKRMITQVMESLAKRIGFRQAPGFSERVIFREMFLLGLTVLDVTETTATSSSLSMSHLAARQEVRELLKALRIPAIDQRISDVRAVAAQTPVAANAPAVAASKAASVLAESAA